MNVNAAIQQAIAQLESERRQIDSKIAALRDVLKPASGGRAGRKAAGRKAKKSKRKPMTAAQKKAVSRRMKKYWAERRKAKAA